MISATPPLPPVTMIMTLGVDTSPATALADACGLPLQDYDPALLREALGQGQRCAVVWSDPAFTIADCLRNQTPTAAAVQAWCQASQGLLDLFARNRRRLVLVAASLITRGGEDDIARLATRLPLITVHQPEPTLPDLPAVLARLVVPQLADLRPVWPELRAASLSVPDDNPTTADVDRLAQVLAAQRAELTDKPRLARLDLEQRLLREQLAELSGLLAEEPAPPPPTAPDIAIGPAHVQIEQAFASLLAALASETQLRLKAEADR